MTVRVNKSSFNIREKLSELGRKFGLKGSELAAAETVQEARDLVSAGRKNMIINGAMQVAQRVAYPSTQPTVSYSNYYTVDRWRMNVSDANFGTWTFSQSNTVPSGKGFAYSWKWDCQSADTSLSSDHYGIAEYRIEAQDLQHLEYGTSSAKPVTISFWVKTNKTGTYVFSIYVNDGARYVSKTYTVNEANSWEYKTITLEGDMAGTINNDTGDGFRLWWWLGAGSSFNSGTMQPGVWRSFSSYQSSTAADLNVNMADSTSNEWFITGVQLEVGRNATEFEHRSYSEELALCQRYFRKFGTGAQFIRGATGTVYSNAPLQTFYPISPDMRATPTGSNASGGTTVTGQGFTSTYSGAGTHEYVATFYNTGAGTMVLGLSYNQANNGGSNLPTSVAFVQLSDTINLSAEL